MNSRSRNFRYLPILRRATTHQIYNYFEKASAQDSTNSTDPTLVAKATSSKIPGEKHETDRIVKIVQIQSGGGGENTITSESDSDSSIANEKYFSPDFESRQTIQVETVEALPDEEELKINDSVKAKPHQKRERESTSSSKPESSEQPLKRFKFKVIG